MIKYFVSKYKDYVFINLNENNKWDIMYRNKVIGKNYEYFYQAAVSAEDKLRELFDLNNCFFISKNKKYLL